MKKDFKTGLIVLFVLILIICGVTVTSFYMPNNINITSSSIYKVDYTKNYKGQYVGLVYLTGTIEEKNNEYNQDWILNTISKLKDDKKNLGMVLYIDSPGGSVYQADQVYFALKEYKASGKALEVYMGPLAASGGYYIACAADEIWANRNTLTGSIGVIAGQTFEITKLLDNLGIKSETIHAGKNKNMGNYNEPLSDEQRAILQSVADECYDQFTLIVSNDRNIPLEKVQKIADGRIYTAKQAQELKLVDKVTSWDSMVDDLRINELNNSDCKIVEFKVPQSNSIMDILNYAKTSIGNERTASSMGIPLSVAQKINAQRQYPAFIYEN